MENFQADFDTSRLKAYSGYCKNEKELKASSSGGAASAFAEAVVDRGGVVFGAAYTSDFKGAEYIIAENKTDLEKLRGSKYIEAKTEITFRGEKTSVYSAAATVLSEGKEVLFTGLGCNIAALYSVLSAKNVDTGKLYTAELICMGTTYSKVEEDYIAALEKKYRSKVTDFSVRYKKKGWKPPYVRAVFENGKEYEDCFYDTDFFYAFDNYTRSGCFNCRFKGDGHKADICLGDFWGLPENDPAYNKNGVSLIITQSEKGEHFLETLVKDKFSISSADLSLALKNNPMYISPKKKKPVWEKFDKTFREKGLHTAVVESIGKVKYLVTKMI